MTPDRARSIETRRALFYARLAAQIAGEPQVNAYRIVAALLRTSVVRDFCARAGIDSDRLLQTADEPHGMTFNECERKVKQDLAARGLEIGSKEHLASVPLHPIDRSLKPVFDAVLQLPGQFAVSPLLLLRDILQTDQPVVSQLAAVGFTSETIASRLEKENP